MTAQPSLGVGPPPHFKPGIASYGWGINGVIVKDGSVSFRGLGKRFLRVDVSLQRYMDSFADAMAEIEREGV